MEITAETIEKLKAAHPGVTLEKLVHPTLDADVMARPPTEGEWKHFQAQRQDDQQKVGANKQLALACIVYPDRDALKKMLAEHPGLADSWAGELVEMAGVARGMRREKY